jgi:hypothetical protein
MKYFVRFLSYIAVGFITLFSAGFINYLPSFPKNIVGIITLPFLASITFIHMTVIFLPLYVFTSKSNICWRYYFIIPFGIFLSLASYAFYTKLDLASSPPMLKYSLVTGIVLSLVSKLIKMKEPDEI